jgi:lipoprotein-anchoring transpeptidase ErfK/SrfK
VAGAGLRDYVLRPGWHLAMAGAGRVYAGMTGGGANAPAHQSAHQSAHNSALASIPTPKPAPRVTLDIAPPNAPELARVEQRLRNNLSAPLYAHFDLFLYVSKAEHGPVAQRMYVFTRTASGGLALLHAWPVSTGRERVEFNKAGLKLPSNTPAGYYELDPKRMYVRYRSSQWGEPMPYAMFFNWEKGGYQTGLAIHAAHGKDIARLGKRASEGCIHLSPRHARTLFHLIRKDYKGAVPRFAYNRRTKTVSNHGFLMRGKKGALRYYKGYKVLVFIEDFGGGSDMVAALM